MPDHGQDPPQRPLTRYRATIRRGDTSAGSAPSGTAEVEIVREVDDRGEHKETVIELPDGNGRTRTETFHVPHPDRTFAEFYHELDRADRALCMRLGIEPGGL